MNLSALPLTPPVEPFRFGFGNSIRLLLVEDDRSIRSTMARILAAEGFEVVVATHGEDALEQLTRMQTLPDLIILDLMMPVVDGWTFRRRQLADPRLAHLPTVVFTAGERACWRTLEVRSDQMISKPVEFDTLLETIHKNTRSAQRNLSPPGVAC